ncbi:MAG: SDR family oxidoreductase, partial [Bacteriovoracaceae bacterium]|nr:SDR family oxidoreductase [Bacteriovoracaceae bacterium]
MKILVTGSTGFIGKKLIPLLSEKVEQVFILVRKESMPKAARLFAEHSNVHLIEGNTHSNDVCSRVEDLTKLTEEVDHIIHLAGGYDLEMSVLDAY